MAGRRPRRSPCLAPGRHARGGHLRRRGAAGQGGRPGVPLLVRRGGDPDLGHRGGGGDAEHRGRRLLRDLFTATFAEACERGMAVSTLYFTAAGIYRSIGYELVGGFDKVQLPTATLAGVRPADAIRLRRAVPGDGAAVQSVYTAWASRQNGPLDPDRTELHRRRGPDHRAPHRCRPRRSTRPPGGRLRLLAARDRVRRLRPHRGRRPARDHAGRDPSAAPHARHLRQRDRLLVLRLSRPDPVDLALPALPPLAVQNRPYMLRVLDLPSAVEPATTRRRWTPRSGSRSPGTPSGSSTAAGGSASPTGPHAASGPPASPGRR